MSELAFQAQGTVRVKAYAEPLVSLLRAISVVTDEPVLHFTRDRIHIISDKALVVLVRATIEQARLLEYSCDRDVTVRLNVFELLKRLKHLKLRRGTMTVAIRSRITVEVPGGGSIVLDEPVWSARGTEQMGPSPATWPEVHVASARVDTEIMKRAADDCTNVQTSYVSVTINGKGVRISAREDPEDEDEIGLKAVTYIIPANPPTDMTEATGHFYVHHFRTLSRAVAIATRTVTLSITADGSLLTECRTPLGILYLLLMPAI